tara:strand:- start:99 stop:572 length:474 start_codon:yes stop_codon:yes gene_type:complete
METEKSLPLLLNWMNDNLHFKDPLSQLGGRADDIVMEFPAYATTALRSFTKGGFFVSYREGYTPHYVGYIDIKNPEHSYRIYVKNIWPAATAATAPIHLVELKMMLTTWHPSEQYLGKGGRWYCVWAGTPLYIIKKLQNWNTFGNNLFLNWKDNPLP